jgi:hypothetical protein
MTALLPTMPRARLGRVHQEDFCQALGIVSEMKHQKEGCPSLKQCFALLREVSSAPVIDLARLLDAVLFNYLIGNNEAHASANTTWMLLRLLKLPLAIPPGGQACPKAFPFSIVPDYYVSLSSPVRHAFALD